VRNLAPDIDPSDLDHIEVLRGPQGTLYGADSMGGLIKMSRWTLPRMPLRVVWRAASPESTPVRSLAIRFVIINVPLGDTLAMRVSGFTRQDPGYIDDPALDAKGVNEGWDSGGRWRHSGSHRTPSPSKLAL